MMPDTAKTGEKLRSGIGARTRTLKEVTTSGPAKMHPFAGLRDRALLMQLLSRCLLLVDAATATNTLLELYHDFAGVIAAPFDELRAIPSVGEPCAQLIKCVHVAAIHLALAPMEQAGGINDWSGLSAYLNTAMAREKKEVFRVLFLNISNVVISDQVMAEGNLCSVRISIRDIAVKSLQLGASAILLIHNHPSGSPKPSFDDSFMTQAIEDTLASLDIRLHDHIIVGKGQFYSFRNRIFLPREFDRPAGVAAVSTYPEFLHSVDRNH